MEKEKKDFPTTWPELGPGLKQGPDCVCFLHRVSFRTFLFSFFPHVKHWAKFIRI